ncbi:hypothetical protein [Ekhidna sp.]|uniref:hypothetical protein n=1 Tax=Ekhidna sp. TaxID=2608089 RepID=UPI0032995A39
MKQFLTLLLLSASITLVNCGDDKDADADFLAQFVGTWQSSNITAAGCNDPEENGTLNCDPFCFEITITANGTYSLLESGSQSPETGTITATETTVTICETGETICDSQDPYSFSGENTFSITFTDEDSPGCQFTAVFNRQ